MAAFARRKALTAPRLYWWKKRLAARLPTTPMPTLSLVPAAIVSGSAGLTIRLPGEVAIEIANASPSWVAAMIAELARPLL